MFWIFLVLFIAVIGAKYYTAVGTRNLERRLNKVKDDLEAARQRLRDERQRQSDIGEQEEHNELRVRYMKELIHDIQIRLTQSEEDGGGKKAIIPPPDGTDEIAAAVMRF